MQSSGIRLHVALSRVAYIDQDSRVSDTIGSAYDMHFLLAAAEHTSIAMIDAVGSQHRS